MTATDLAKRGAKVIICCRSLERAEAALEDIKKDSGSQLVENVQLDLASLKSVRKCAETILEKEEKVDYLINNAGKSNVLTDCLAKLGQNSNFK